MTVFVDTGLMVTDGLFEGDGEIGAPCLKIDPGASTALAFIAVLRECLLSSAPTADAGVQRAQIQGEVCRNGRVLEVSVIGRE
jgi:hypothetical protein